MRRRPRSLPIRSTVVALCGCAVALLAIGCGGTALEASSSDAGSSDAGSSDAGSSDAGSSDAGTKPIPGSCQPFTPMDAPGMYGWEYADDDVGYWFLKRDDANDRCLLLYVQPDCESAHGVKSSSCYDIGKVILTNSAADCQISLYSPVINGQTVEASCGGGTVDFGETEGVLWYNYIKVFFKFPQKYPWVPASDSYCLDKNVYENSPFVSGC